MGTAYEWHIVKLLSGFGIVCLTIVVMLIIVKIWLDEKGKVHRMPKVPMTLCDTHGAYPSSSTLRLVVPAEGRQDLIVEQCPQCYYDRLRESKRIPS